LPKKPPPDSTSQQKLQRRKAEDDDRQLFEAEMGKLGQVKRLAQGPVRVVTPPRPPSPGQPFARAAAVRGPSSAPVVAGPALTEQTRAGDAFAFTAEGVDKRAVRELESGARPPEATLDLHGRKAAVAEASLESFVRGSLASGRRVVHIVHGRGLGSGDSGPVLRKLVQQRLTSGALATHVLALVSAPAKLGGPGASLVWLRRSS
jgi:DNA-nicking Smr family endonuclease